MPLLIANCTAFTQSLKLCALFNTFKILSLSLWSPRLKRVQPAFLYSCAFALSNEFGFASIVTLQLRFAILLSPYMKKFPI